MTPKDSLTVTWYYMETGDELETMNSSTEESGSGYIGFSIKSIMSDNIFPSGNYKVEVYLNDELHKTLDFLIK